MNVKTAKTQTVGKGRLRIVTCAQERILPDRIFGAVAKLLAARIISDIDKIGRHQELILHVTQSQIEGSLVGIESTRNNRLAATRCFVVEVDLRLDEVLDHHPNIKIVDVREVIEHAKVDPGRVLRGIVADDSRTVLNAILVIVLNRRRVGVLVGVISLNPANVCANRELARCRSNAVAVSDFELLITISVRIESCVDRNVVDVATVLCPLLQRRIWNLVDADFARTTNCQTAETEPDIAVKPKRFRRIRILTRQRQDS